MIVKKIYRTIQVYIVRGLNLIWNSELSTYNYLPSTLNTTLSTTNEFPSFYLAPTRCIEDLVSCWSFRKSIFFYIFRKYNILRVYCKNFRPKYEIFTKLKLSCEATKLINY